MMIPHEEKHLAELDLPDLPSPLVDDVLPNIREAIDLYVHGGIRPGGFTLCCLKNDLQGAVMRADETSLQNLRPIMCYVYHCVPGGLWGNNEVVSQHIKRGLEARE